MAGVSLPRPVSVCSEKRIGVMRVKRYQAFVFAGLAVLVCLMVVPGRMALAEPDSPVAAVNASEGIGLKGYDPVAYFVTGRPIEGIELYSFVWRGVTYRFASEENLNRFKAEPQKYLPQYGGYCAYAMSLNRIADIDPSRWAIVDGKLYLNNGHLAQSLWSLNRRGNIESADRNWPLYPKQPEGK